jgi:hypothetical protein
MTQARTEPALTSYVGADTAGSTSRGASLDWDAATARRTLTARSSDYVVEAGLPGQAPVGVRWLDLA